MKNFIKAGIILFSLTTQLEASLVSNDLVLDNTSAMTQLEANLVSNDLVLDNTSATVKVQQKPLPARWPAVVSGLAVVSGVLGVPVTVLGMVGLFELIMLPKTGSKEYDGRSDSEKKNIDHFIKAASFLARIATPLGLILISDMLILISHIVDFHKAKNAFSTVKVQQKALKVQQKALPARWPAVVSGVLGVPVTALGMVVFLTRIVIPKAGSKEYDDINSESLKKGIPSDEVKKGMDTFVKIINVFSGIATSLGLILISYTVKRIVDRRKAKKVLKMEEQQAYKKTRLVSSPVAHA
jgi:hypothetical protein